MNVSFKDHQLVVAGLQQQISLLTQRCVEHRKTIDDLTGLSAGLVAEADGLREERDALSSAYKELSNCNANQGNTIVDLQITVDNLSKECNSLNSKLSSRKSVSKGRGAQKTKS